jgi:hypothetical protein
MRDLRRFLPFLLVPLGLLAASLLLHGGPSAFAEDKPTPPAGGEPPAMGDAGGMEDPGAAPAAPDPDDDESDAPPALNERVKKAIKNGITWLKNHQLSDGGWGNVEGNHSYGAGKTGDQYKHPAGATALALYTLLKCKVPMDDPYIKKGFKFLKDKYPVPGSSYETSMMLLAVTATADPFKRFSASAGAAEAQKVKLAGEWLAWATKLKDALLAKRSKSHTLGWRYNLEAAGTKGGGTPGGEEDLSSTQLATLALLAADRCNVKVDSKVWHDIATFSMKQQQDDGPEWERAVYDRKAQAAKKDTPAPSGGDYAKPKPNDPKSPKDRARGFAYIKSDKLSPDEGQATGGMTACGIGNLQMVRYVLGPGKRKDAAWEPRDAEALQRVYDGCAWLDQNWSPAANPGKKNENVYHIYYMYCVERAFDLIGNQLLGSHHWYSEMAEQLCGMQRDKGFWNSQSAHKPEEVLDTCFALLVLKQATRGGIPYGSVTSPGDEPPVDNRGK